MRNAKEVVQGRELGSWEVLLEREPLSKGWGWFTRRGEAKKELEEERNRYGDWMR